MKFKYLFTVIGSQFTVFFNENNPAAFANLTQAHDIANPEAFFQTSISSKEALIVILCTPVFLNREPITVNRNDSGLI